MIPVTAVSAQDKGVVPPTELWAAQTDPTTITLVWQGAPGAAQYLVFGPKSKKGEAGAEIQQLTTLGSNASRFVIPVVGSGLLHQFSIQAVDAKGLASDKVEFNPVIPEAKQAGAKTVPAPSSVTAIQTKPGEIRIMWSAVPGATSYFLSRSVAPGGFGALCSLCPTKTNYADKRVTAGAKHIYTVSAITPFGTSKKTWSNEVTPTSEGVAGNTETGDTQGLPKGVTNPKATLKSPTSVELTWGGGDGATTFRIFRVIAGSAEQIATLPGNVTRVADTFVRGLAGELSYQIQAVNAKGSSEKATIAIAAEKAATDSAVSTPSPKAPTGLKATVISPTGIRLTWIAGFAGGLYHLKRQVGSGPAQVIGTFPGSVSNFLDHFPPGAMPGLIGYWVEAVDGKSAASEKITISTDPSKQADSSPPSPPSDLKAAVTAPYTVTLSWKPVTGATYQIKRGGLLGPVITVVESISSTVGRFVDLIPPELWKGRSIVYTIIAITTGIGVGDPKSASAPATVTVTIDPQKAGAAPPPPGAVAPDSAAEEVDIDSLPRPRPRAQ